MEKPPMQLDSLIAWINANIPWLGHLLLSVVGGITAHVREWEATTDYTVRQHVIAMLRRTLLAITAGFMWYHIAAGYAWNGSPFSYVGASLVGLFAPDFFDLLWAIFKNRVMGAAANQQGNKT